MINGDQGGFRLDLKPSPDELIIVLERTRLVWTSLAALMTEWT